jgi:PKD repeat protein
VADIGNLDVTTAGTYDVTLTVTDFAGNQASLVIPVTVEP